MNIRNLVLLAASVMIGYLSLAHADTHDEARALREQGDILPLETILQKARQQYPGKVIETELEREHQSYVYEIEILDAQGKVWELEYDAHNGELLKRERDD